MGLSFSKKQVEEEFRVIKGDKLEGGISFEEFSLWIKGMHNSKSKSHRRRRSSCPEIYLAALKRV